jgi:ribosomal protein L24E
MGHFVNYRKRGINLPGGHKDLAELLKAKKPKQTVIDQGKNRDQKLGYCMYCGAPAGYGYSTGFLGADGQIAEEVHFWCEKCQQDLAEFNSKPGNRPPELPADFNVDNPGSMESVMQLWVEIEKRRDAFVRERVAERKKG